MLAYKCTDVLCIKLKRGRLNASFFIEKTPHMKTVERTCFQVGAIQRG